MEYEDRLRQLDAFDPVDGEKGSGIFSTAYEKLSHEILQIERKTILQLRNENVINDEVHRRIQRDVDLAEARLR